MIIGLCGRIGAGKDTIADFLVDHLGFKKVVMSDVIKEEMKKEGIEPTRENMQNFSKAMKEKFGRGIWARKTLDYINEHKIKNVVISGVRDTEEVKEFRKNPEFILIGVYAPKELRYERVIKRGDKKDPKTFEEAELQDKREEEIFDLVKKCESEADVVITNDFTNVENLYSLIEVFFEDILK